MGFKFELNLEENQGVYVGEDMAFFRNPTFEKIVDFLKKEYGYKDIIQIEDIILTKKERYKTFYVRYTSLGNLEEETIESMRLTITKLTIID